MSVSCSLLCECFCGCLDHYFFPSEPRASVIQESPQPANPQATSAQAISPLPPVSEEGTALWDRAYEQFSVKKGYASLREADALLKKWALPLEKK